MTSGPFAWPARMSWRRMSQCRSPGSTMPATGWASHDEIAASASDAVKGCSKTREFVPIRRKAQSCEPCEAHELAARQHRFEPRSALFVLIRLRMIGIEEQVCVDEDHR